MPRPLGLTIRATSTGLKGVIVTHDPGEQERGLALLQAVLPALRAVDRGVKQQAERGVEGHVSGSDRAS